MKRTSAFTLRRAGGTLFVILSLIGCGGNLYQVAEVDGVVLIRGKPADKIYIQFIPEVVGETSPPTSTAETSSDGRFTLQLMEGKEGATRPGAVVGVHRVVLRDMQLAQSATGAGVPIRLHQKYALAGSTPLTQDVKEGNQTIEIKIP
jgi:hypothetical protein